MARKPLPILLSDEERQQLSDLAYAKRVSMAELIRQWIEREWAKRLKREKRKQ